MVKYLDNMKIKNIEFEVAVGHSTIEEYIKDSFFAIFESAISNKSLVRFVSKDDKPVFFTNNENNINMWDINIEDEVIKLKNINNNNKEDKNYHIILFYVTLELDADGKYIDSSFNKNVIRECSNLVRELI